MEFVTEPHTFESAEDTAKAVKVFKKLPASTQDGEKKVCVLSLFDDKIVKNFSDELVKILKKR